MTFFALLSCHSLQCVSHRYLAQAKLHDGKPTILKKTDTTYQLKMRNSRSFLSEVSTKFGSLPFSLR